MLCGSITQKGEEEREQKYSSHMRRERKGKEGSGNHTGEERKVLQREL